MTTGVGFPAASCKEGPETASTSVTVRVHVAPASVALGDLLVTLIVV